MHTGKKRNKRMILGVFICIVFAVIIMLFFAWKSRQVEKFDCSGIPVQREENGVGFEVESVSFDDNGVLYITAQAENDKIQYTYKNWVLGKGKNIYRKIRIILVTGDGKTAYGLPTYPHATSSQSAEQGQAQITNGIIAYAPKRIIKKGPFSIAVIFEDREGKRAIIYPREEKNINEK